MPPVGREHQAPKEGAAPTKEAEVKANEKKDAGSGKEPKAAPPKPLTPLDVLHRNIALLDKFVETRDTRFLGRVLRYTNFIRTQLPTAQLRTAVDTYVLDASRRSLVQELVSAAAAHRPHPVAAAAAAQESPSNSSAGDVEISLGNAAADGSSSSSSAAAAAKAAPAPSPAGASPAAPAAAPKPPRPSATSALEVEVYFQLLGLSMLVAQRGNWAAVAAAAARLIDYASGFNRRTLDVFVARAYTYFVVAQEQQAAAGAGAGDSSGGAGPSGSGVHDALRPVLLKAHRTSTLRHDEFGVATLLNLLLRGYVATRAYDAGAKLLAKAPFPEAASANQLARYMYYKGRIQAVGLLDYSDAVASLTQALRKAPPSAPGLVVVASKFLSIAQLLTGDIPERSLFAGTPSFRAALQPYFDLTRAVRGGDMAAFRTVVARASSSFESDGTGSLVRRLEANVIKAGLRSLALSYSRLTFAHVAARLGLGSAEDAEFLCAKAIHDGVIEATLDHSAGTLTSVESANVYSTKEPQEAFQRRIGFLLDVHNEAVKGMRFPQGALRGAALESAEERRAREREEAALAADIEEGMLDEEDEEGADGM